MVAASMSEAAAGRRPAGEVCPSGSTRTMSALEPAVPPPPKKYAAPPTVAAAASWSGWGRSPSTRARSPSTPTIVESEESIELRPPSTSARPPGADVTAGSCTGAGRRPSPRASRRVGRDGDLADPVVRGFSWEEEHPTTATAPSIASDQAKTSRVNGNRALWQTPETPPENGEDLGQRRRDTEPLCRRGPKHGARRARSRRGGAGTGCS